MKKWSVKLGFLSILMLAGLSANAQSPDGGSSNLLVAFIAFLVFILLVVIVMVSDRLMRVTAIQTGADKTGVNYSIFPNLEEIFASSNLFTTTEPVIRLKKGYNIPLEGEAEKVEKETTEAVRYAIKPTDFEGMSPIPKVVVEIGENVKAGDALFYDKKNPEVVFCSPVSGQLIEVNRGEKRRIIEIVILADKVQTYRSVETSNLEAASREELVGFLATNGAFAFLRQRPYNIVPEVNAVPANIFVSTFNSAPLAACSNMAVAGNEAAFQQGLEILAKLTVGNVHLGLNAADTDISSAFTDATGVEKHWFAGPHPAGNVGIQIHQTVPINKGDIVWTADINAVIVIGRLFTEGRFNTERVVALTGAELNSTHYVRTHQGANIEGFLADNLRNEHVRVVSGDVLTGTTIPKNGYLGFFDNHVTVLEEGDYYEMFGWMAPIKPRPSISNTIPTFLYPEKMVADTNTHGEKRAFVVTGQYESVLPMDVYPQHLFKSIIVNDLERMEGLGIYELVEEDVALCEFACTSKQDIQAILREGLNMMRDQG
ncbi:MAG: Na+-transporting NADH:ubiquinone oxidoreductase subunit A [Cognaticolwellia sp.]